MSASSNCWFPSLFRRRTAAGRPRRARPQLELLEERCVPTTFNVNTLADLSIAAGVNPNGTIVGQGTTVTLRSAIQAANVTAGNNTINLSLAGAYKITLAGTPGETDNAAGEFAILTSGGNLTIVNTSGGVATVDGNHLNRVFDVNPGNTDNPATKITVTMQGFTITNGVAQPGNLAPGSGGGIRDQGNASLTLTNMVVTGNSATADGGGVAMENAPASTPWTLTLNATTVSNNHAGDAGGGVETDGAGKVFINADSVITANTAVNQGGGVWLDAVPDGVTSVTITNPGTGYTAPPMVTFGAPQNAGGTTATGVATATGGVVTSVTITNPGSGYTAAPNVTFSPPPAGTKATGTPNLGFSNSATLTVTDAVISNNAAFLVDGGIGNAGKGAVAIVNSTVENNFSAGAGGGFGDEGNLGTLTISNSYFLDNAAVGNGGAIQEGGATTTITNTEIKGNTSGASGGGVFANGVTLTLANSTVANNTAAVAGGGIELETTSLNSTINNTTIAGNSVLNNNGLGNGGGIDTSAGFDRVVLTNDTINGNFADNGGGIAMQGTTSSFFLIQNTIIAQNTADVAGPDGFVAGGAGYRDLGGNLIGNGSGFTVDSFGLGTNTQVGTALNPIDPKLGPLQFNGGPTVGASGATIQLETEAISGTSPAKDKGIASGSPTTDERGFLRPDAGRNETPDVGAFEFQDAAAVAEFKNGVFVFNQAANAFVQLDAASASLLAVNPDGDVAAEFAGAGVWRYTASTATWKQLSPADASLLVIDAGGDVAAEFAGAGVWRYTASTGMWQQVTAVNASLLVIDAGGDLAAQFAGAGVWRYTASTGMWQQVTAVNASLLVIDAGGNLAAQFAGAGVWRYTASTGMWQQVTSGNASLLAMDSNGDVAAEFPGQGVFLYPAAGGFQHLTGVDASLLALDGNGDVFADFPAAGVYEYSILNGWMQVSTSDPSILVAN